MLEIAQFYNDGKVPRDILHELHTFFITTEDLEQLEAVMSPANWSNFLKLKNTQQQPVAWP